MGGLLWRLAKAPRTTGRAKRNYMNIPETFLDRLERDFDGRLRARWSKNLGEIHIEQKVGRASLAPTYVSEVDDDLIRARDGYMYVMAIRPGDRMRCPDCNSTIKVPIMRTGEAVCGYCKMKGRDGRHKAAYYPLGDLLLDHLKRIDPMRTYRTELVKVADRKNDAIMAARQRETSNQIETGTKENWTRMVGIQSTGYTGKVFTGNPTS